MGRAGAGAILDLVGCLYDAADSDEGWPEVIEKLRQVMNASTACVARMGPDPKLGDTISTSDPSYAARYIEDYPELPELVRAVLTIPVGDVFEDRAAIGHETLVKTRFWNDWMAPQDMYGGLSCRVLETGSSFLYLDVQRGRRQREFDSSDAATMRLLAPHFRRAVEINGRRRLAAATDGTGGAPGNLVVDRHMVPVMEGPGGTLPPSVLERLCEYPPLRTAVQEACVQPVRPARAPEAISIQAANGVAPLIVMVAPFAGPVGEQPCALLTIRLVSSQLPAGLEESIRALFGLTQAETRLAALLAAGVTLRDAAASAGISFGTARNYLIRIFRKTGTHQQGQLVALLRSVQPPMQ